MDSANQLTTGSTFFFRDMMYGYKIMLSFFLAIILLIVVVNLPIVPYTAACSTQYESFMTYAFPCGIFSYCWGGSNVKTITLSSAVLYAGNTSTPSSNATSSLTFSLNNPGCSTRIASLTLWNVNQTMVSHWDNNTGPVSKGNAIDFNSVQSKNNLIVARVVNSFVYYPDVPSGHAQTIIPNDGYNYVISFSNGQSESGDLIAQKGNSTG